jgi:hypothetical protein
VVAKEVMEAKEPGATEGDEVYGAAGAVAVAGIGLGAFAYMVCLVCFVWEQRQNPRS